jgi:hypothetical protein
VKNKLHPQHDWLPVLGQVVDVRQGDETVRTGIVDGVTPDNKILWISADGAETRTMYQRSDGYSVWIEYKWETASTL